MLLANTGAILSFLDGPAGGDLGFHVLWSKFPMVRRFFAYQSGEDHIGCYIMSLKDV